MRSQWQLHWQGATWATGHLLSRPASDDEETAGHTAEASPKCDAWTSSEAERYTATPLPRSTHSCLCFYLLCVLMHWCTGSQWVNHSSLKHLKYSNRSYLLLHVNFNFIIFKLFTASYRRLHLLYKHLQLLQWSSDQVRQTDMLLGVFDFNNNFSFTLFSSWTANHRSY